MASNERNCGVEKKKFFLLIQLLLGLIGFRDFSCADLFYCNRLKEMIKERGVARRTESCLLLVSKKVFEKSI